MMGFFSNLFAKQNCAVCGKECGTLHRSKLRDGQFLCDDCGNKCSKYIRLSELTLDEAKEHMAYMARMKRVFDEVFDKTEFRVNAYPSTPTQMGLVFCDELGMLYIDMTNMTGFDDEDRKSTRLNSSHRSQSRMPSSA